MVRIRHVVAGIAVVASIGFLAGCTVQEKPLADLAGDREALDELPSLEDYAYDAVDVSSSRFVGTHEGTSLWIARGVEPATVCLVADPGGDGWLVSCGGGGGPMGTFGEAGRFAVLPDDAAAPEGSTQISENVYAW